jgi:hypothetical protein
MKLWILERKVKDVIFFESAGVFDSEEKAVAACTHETDFIYSIELNTTIESKQGYYPLMKQGEFLKCGQINPVYSKPNTDLMIRFAVGFNLKEVPNG